MIYSHFSSGPIRQSLTAYTTSTCFESNINININVFAIWNQIEAMQSITLREIVESVTTLMIHTFFFVLMVLLFSNFHFDFIYLLDFFCLLSLALSFFVRLRWFSFFILVSIIIWSRSMKYFHHYVRHVQHTSHTEVSTADSETRANK